MKLGRRKEINNAEAKIILHQEGFKIKPSYCHDDYMFTSFTMPYDLKDKLDRISKRYGVTRSGFVQMLIRNYQE